MIWTALEIISAAVLVVRGQRDAQKPLSKVKSKHDREGLVEKLNARKCLLVVVFRRRILRSTFCTFSTLTRSRRNCSWQVQNNSTSAKLLSQELLRLAYAFVGRFVFHKYLGLGDIQKRPNSFLIIPYMQHKWPMYKHKHKYMYLANVIFLSCTLTLVTHEQLQNCTQHLRLKLYVHATSIGDPECSLFDSSKCLLSVSCKISEEEVIVLLMRSTDPDECSVARFPLTSRILYEKKI